MPPVPVQIFEARTHLFRAGNRAVNGLAQPPQQLAKPSCSGLVHRASSHTNPSRTEGLPILPHCGLDNPLLACNLVMERFTRRNSTHEEPLAGDASTRRYSRLSYEGGKTTVLVQYPGNICSQLQRDLEVRSWCSARGLRVPSLGEHDFENGWAVIEDFGPDDAECSMVHASIGGRTGLCVRALRPLATLAALSPAALPKWNPPLNYERLRWELSGFELWCLTYRLGTRPSAEISRWLDDLAAEIDLHPRRVCHRDYHLNNLFFLDEGEVGVIDYQDILVGPDTYDMVSLLGERAMPELIDEKCRLTLEEMWSEMTAAESCWQIRRRSVRLQRGLKVLGTFARLAVAGKLGYEAWLVDLAVKVAPDLAQNGAPSELVGLLLDLGPRGSSV